MYVNVRFIVAPTIGLPMPLATRELVMAASVPVLMREYAGRYILGNDTLGKGIASSNDTKSSGRTRTRSVKESLTSLAVRTCQTREAEIRNKLKTHIKMVHHWYTMLIV